MGGMAMICTASACAEPMLAAVGVICRAGAPQHPVRQCDCRRPFDHLLGRSITPLDLARGRTTAAGVAIRFLGRTGLRHSSHRGCRTFDRALIASDRAYPSIYRFLAAAEGPVQKSWSPSTAEHADMATGVERRVIGKSGWGVLPVAGTSEASLHLRVKRVAGLAVQNVRLKTLKPRAVTILERSTMRQGPSPNACRRWTSTGSVEPHQSLVIGHPRNARGANI